MDVLVRKQRRHAKLRDRREDRLHGLQVHLGLRLPLQLLCKGGCHFIAQGIGNNHIHLAIGSCHLLAIEIRLLRHFQNPAILAQIVRAGI